MDVSPATTWRRPFSYMVCMPPARAASWDAAWSRELPPGWDADLPVFSPDDGAVATRAASGKAINALAPHLPTLIGGSADLAPSNNTWIKDVPDQQAATPAGANFHFGVREHAMASIANGLAVHGGVRPYVATFFVFTDYMRPALRLAALMGEPVIWVLTHDSIGVGEDGPTHQPVEHLAALRAIPNLLVIRPADGNETAQAYRVAMKRNEGPVAVILTRQKMPTFDRNKMGPAAGLAKGAYVLSEVAGGPPQVILIATGSEVSLAVDAQEKLLSSGIRARVVSMPSWELFAQQSAEYRNSVIPRDVPARVSIEAGVSLGWHRWVGDHGVVIGLDRFGASGPGPVLVKQFGFTAYNIVRAAMGLVKS